MMLGRNVESGRPSGGHQSLNVVQTNLTPLACARPSDIVQYNKRKSFARLKDELNSGGVVPIGLGKKISFLERSITPDSNPS